jgi:hypothetical protein
MRALRMVTLAGREYPIAFTSNALVFLEEHTGMSVSQFAAALKRDAAGIRGLQMLLWAGLEGGRLRDKHRKARWTLEEIGDLIDGTDNGVSDVWRQADTGQRVKRDADGKAIIENNEMVIYTDESLIVPAHHVMETMMEAFKDAFPVLRKDEQAKPANPPQAENQPGATV